MLILFEKIGGKVGLISEQDKEYLKNEFDKNLKREVQLLYFADQQKNY